MQPLAPNCSPSTHCFRSRPGHQTAGIGMAVVCNCLAPYPDNTSRRLLPQPYFAFKYKVLVRSSPKRVHTLGMTILYLEQQEGRERIASIQALTGIFEKSRGLYGCILVLLY